jgi:hypothetical protein
MLEVAEWVSNGGSPASSGLGRSYDDLHPRPFARLGIDLQRAIHQAYTLFHADEAQRRGPLRRVSVEADSIVRDRHAQLVSPHANTNFRVSAARVLDDIVDRLLGDAVEAKRNFQREIFRNGIVYESDRDAVCGARFPTEAAQRWNEPKLSEFRRVQFV